MQWLSLVWVAWLGGALLALVAAPLGCMVLWRRLAFFADTLAHGAMLGAALAVLANFSQALGMGLVALFLLVLLFNLEDRRLPNDANLAAMAAFLLSLGLVVLSLLPSAQSRVLGYLFGNLITLPSTHLLWLAPICIFLLVVIRRTWQNQVAIALHSDLAFAMGIKVARSRLLLMTILALFCTLAVPLVGSLLVGGLLILPALIARLFATSPKQMAIIAIIVAQIGVCIGIWGSVWLDLPTGLAIILALASAFLSIFFWQKWHGTPRL